MKTTLSMIAAPAAAMTLVKGALLAGVLLALAPGAVLADVPDKGTTPYVTHFIFRPLQSIEIPELGTATVLEAVGTTENLKGEKMLDKMSARCAAPRRGRSSNLVRLPDSPGLRHQPRAEPSNPFAVSASRPSGRRPLLLRSVSPWLLTGRNTCRRSYYL